MSEKVELISKLISQILLTTKRSNMHEDINEIAVTEAKGSKKMCHYLASV